MIFWFLLLLTLSILIIGSKIFRVIDELDNREKNSLDGLRCILALMVVFHHFFFNYNYHYNGSWNIYGYRYFELIGPFSVGLFFTLSGYLFSGIDKKNMSWWLFFYKKRLLRIVPVSVLSSIICIIAAYIYGPNKSIELSSIIPWFDGGITNIRPPIFGIKEPELINSGVTWTLTWEWRLYFILPFISLIIPTKKRLIISLLVASISYFTLAYLKVFNLHGNTEALRSVFFFSSGFACRFINSKSVSEISKNNALQVVVIFLFLASCYIKKISAPALPIVSSLIFLMICNGASFFGLLKSTGAIRIGTLSYSIYLLHGIFWYIGFKEFISTSYLITSSTLIFILMLAFSFFVSKYIEYPIYEASKKKKHQHSN